MGGPKAVAIRLFAIEKFAGRILRYNKSPGAARTIHVKWRLMAAVAERARHDHATIQRTRLWKARNDGCGKRSARFLVQPSRS
jgi:hypothetical protein